MLARAASIPLSMCHPHGIVKPNAGHPEILIVKNVLRARSAGECFGPV